MGRQKAENLRRDKYQKYIPEDRGENLHTDLSKERERGAGERGKEQEQRSEQQVSEQMGRW